MSETSCDFTRFSSHPVWQEWGLLPMAELLLQEGGVALCCAHTSFPEGWISSRHCLFNATGIFSGRTGTFLWKWFSELLQKNLWWDLILSGLKNSQGFYDNLSLVFYLQGCCGAQGPPATILPCWVTGTVHGFRLVPWTPEHLGTAQLPEKGSQPAFAPDTPQLCQAGDNWARTPRSSSSPDKHWQQLGISRSLNAGKMKCCSSLNDIWIRRFKSWSGIWKYPENRIIFMKQKFTLPASPGCQGSLLLKMRPSVMEISI